MNFNQSIAIDQYMFVLIVIERKRRSNASCWAALLPGGKMWQPQPNDLLVQKNFGIGGTRTSLQQARFKPCHATAH